LIEKLIGLLIILDGVVSIVWFRRKLGWLERWIIRHRKRLRQMQLYEDLGRIVRIILGLALILLG